MMISKDISDDEYCFEADKVEDVSIFLVTVIMIVNRILIKIIQVWTMKKENVYNFSTMRVNTWTATIRKRLVAVSE